MIRYSVLIPQRNAGNELARQLPELRRVLDLLALPYEVICIDQASAPLTRDMLPQLLDQHPILRVLTFDRVVGLETALAAGIAAARGELVVATGVGKEYPLQQIPHLIAELSRTDVVFGRQKRVGWPHAWQQLAKLPRRCLLGPKLCSTDYLFWAAHREAIAGVESARGTARFLPWLVATRGYRVGEMPIRLQPARPAIREVWPHPADLLAVWWLRRRYRPTIVEELRPIMAEVVTPEAAGVSHWIDGAQSQARREAKAPQRGIA